MAGVNIKKDDNVMVMTGKDRGKTGRVVRVMPKDGRVMVEGVARAKRHTRPSQKNRQGGIMEQELPIDISNVQIVCRHCGRPTRVGHRLEGDLKLRMCRKCGGDL